MDMRYSRIRKVRSQRRYISILIVVILIFGGVYLFTAGAMGKFISELIKPILKSNQESDKLGQGDPINEDSNLENQDTELKLPQADGQEDQENQAPKTTETIKVEAMNFFGIQMGAFNSKDNAQTIAEQLKTKGGAGYVLEEQYFRVMGMVFLNEGDAVAVKEQLRSQSVEVQLYELKCSGVDMDITASSDKIEGIKSSFTLLKEKIGLMESLIKDLDNDKITSEIAINKLGEIKNEVRAKADQLNQYSASQEGSQVLEGLKVLFSEQVSNLDQITQGNITDKVAISSKIKYTYIDMIYKYKKYIEQITSG